MIVSTNNSKWVLFTKITTQEKNLALFNANFELLRMILILLHSLSVSHSHAMDTTCTQLIVRAQ